MAEKIGYYFKNVADLSLIDTPAFADASAEDLRVLLALVLCDCDLSRKELQERSLCDAETVTGALQYWRGAGVLAKGKKIKETATKEKEDTKAKTEDTPAEKKKKKVASLAKLGEHTAAELADCIYNNNLSALIEACQQIVGHTLNTAEINIIVGMNTELSLNGNYIITLVSHCYEAKDNCNLRYVERVAISLTDEGIMTEDSLIQYLEDRKRFASFEMKLKKKFGMGERDFTKTQAKFVSKWEKVYNFPLEIITLAYDITVEYTNKVDFKYMDSILSSWHNAGCTTEAEVVALIEKESVEHKMHYENKKVSEPKQKPKNSTVSGSSFDTDEFFNLALERSFKK